MNGAIVHFEIHASDVERAKAFYSAVSGARDSMLCTRRTAE